MSRQLTREEIDSGDLFMWYATSDPNRDLELRFRKADGVIVGVGNVEVKWFLDIVDGMDEAVALLSDLFNVAEAAKKVVKT